jgi:hypothetical protein
VGPYPFFSLPPQPEKERKKGNYDGFSVTDFASASGALEDQKAQEETG